MKKVNIILNVIGFLSIIGGMLAFNAQHRFTATLFCYTTVGSGINPKVFAPIPGARYTTNNGTTQLICTVPGNNAYSIKAVRQDN